MSISINCDVSLSKKLRSFIQNGNSINLIIPKIENGKGKGILSVSDNIDMDSNNILEIGETSIILTPLSIAEELPDNNGIANIFVNSINEENNPVIKKIGVVKAPEKGEESKAMATNGIKIPKEFEDLKNTECKKYITNTEELIEAASLAKKNKKSDINIEEATTEREKAVLKERKEKEEAIDIPAFIVNEKVGSLTINDLDIALSMNVPYDLSNISARRIMASSDLKFLLKNGYIRFISPKERSKFVNIILEEAPSLEVYDSKEEAETAISGKNSILKETPRIIDEKEAVEISESNIDEPTEEENMIINLTKNMPKTQKESTNHIINRQTSHSNKSSTPNNTPNPNLKTIKRSSF